MSRRGGIVLKAKKKAPGRNPEQAAILAVADRQAGKLATAFTGSLVVLRSGVNHEQLQIALERGDVGAAVNAFPWDLWARTFERMAVPRIQETMRQSGEAVGRRTKIEKVEFSLQGVFNLMNPQAYRIASEIAGRLVTRITESTRWAIRQVIADAQRNGVSVRNQAQSVRQILVDTAGLDAPRARRLARFQEGLQARGAAPSVVSQRVTDYRDQLITDRARTIARHECLVPESLVDTAVVRAAFRRPYAGNIADVVTRRGRKLSATPNHPVLTKRGWVGAGLLNPGDELICYRGQQDLRSVGDGDEVHRPAPVSEIFQALEITGAHHRVASTDADFHGDGMKSEVDVLRAYGLLRVGRFASLDKPLLDGLLAPAHMVGARFCGCQYLLGMNKAECLCESPFPDSEFLEGTEYYSDVNAQRLGDVLGSLAAVVTLSGEEGVSIREVATVVATDLTVTEEVLEGLGLRPHYSGAAYGPQYPVNRNAHLGGHEPTAEASEIEFDRVVSVGLRSWAGHVFNLETAYGYFTVNGIYTGNTQEAAVAGQEELWSQAQEAGLIDSTMQMEWITAPLEDGRVCPICEDMDGQRVRRGQLFVSPYDGSTHARPPAHVQCLPGDALVLPRGRVTAASKRWIEGDLVVLQVADALPLSCTPNHPVLTRYGWVPARLLDIGDEVAHPGFRNGRRATDGQDVDTPARIEEIAEPLLIGVTPQPTTAEDFHGDGIASEVAVVGSNSLLGDAPYAGSFEVPLDDAFVRADVGLPFLAAERDLTAVSQAVPATKGGDISGSDLSPPLSVSHSRPLQRLRFGLPTDVNASEQEAPSDSWAPDSEVLSDGILGLSAEVEPYDLVYRKITAKGHRAYSGFVYNIETSTGYYLAAGYAIHNCRCTLSLVVDDPLEDEVLKYDPNQPRDSDGKKIDP